MNIVIVGVGALGKRHLQSMLELPVEYRIYAVEVVEETLNNLKKEFDNDREENEDYLHDCRQPL